MMQSRCDKEIGVLVRSRYPLIYVVSWEVAEEEKVENNTIRLVARKWS